MTTTDDLDLDLDTPLAEEVALKPFRFRLGGKQRQLPNLGLLTTRQRAQMRDEQNRDLATIAREILGDHELAELLDELPVVRAARLTDAWVAHSRPADRDADADAEKGGDA